MIPLSDVEFEECSVNEVSSRREKAKFKGEFKTFCHILTGRCHAWNVRGECHHSVKAEQQGVKEEASDVVESLIENYAPEATLLILSALVILICRL